MNLERIQNYLSNQITNNSYFYLFIAKNTIYLTIFTTIAIIVGKVLKQLIQHCRDQYYQGTNREITITNTNNTPPIATTTTTNTIEEEEEIEQPQSIKNKNTTNLQLIKQTNSNNNNLEYAQQLVSTIKKRSLLIPQLKKTISKILDTSNVNLNDFAQFFFIIDDEKFSEEMIIK